MIIVVPQLSGYGGVMRVCVSLPLVEALLDEPGGKYMLPEDVPPTDSHDDLHKIRRQKAARFAQAAKKRAPSLQSLVKLALKCDSVEQIGKKLKERFERQQQRRGITTGRPRQAETNSMSS
jgi:hypothetical protein